MTFPTEWKNQKKKTWFQTTKTEKGATRIAPFWRHTAAPATARQLGVVEFPVDARLHGVEAAQLLQTFHVPWKVRKSPETIGFKAGIQLWDP